jgi:hypothetical protein
MQSSREAAYELKCIQGRTGASAPISDRLPQSLVSG